MIINHLNLLAFVYLHAGRGEEKARREEEGKTVNNRNAPRCSYYDFSKSGSARTEFNEHKLIQLVSGCPASLPVSTRALPTNDGPLRNKQSSRLRV